MFHPQVKSRIMFSDIGSGFKSLVGRANALIQLHCHWSRTALQLIIYHALSLSMRGNHGDVLYCTVLCTVKFLAPIWRQTTSLMFSEPCFRQTHTARHRQIKRKYYPVKVLGTSCLLLQTDITTLPYSARDTGQTFEMSQTSQIAFA